MSNPKVILKQQVRNSVDYIVSLVEILEENEDLFDYKPTDESRTTSEILLHIIRSIQYYLTGISNDTWETVNYTLHTYDTGKKIMKLIEEVKLNSNKLITSIDKDELHKKYTKPEKSAFGLNLMIELLYHQSHHIGQVQTYLRLQDIEPPKFDFLI